MTPQELKALIDSDSQAASFAEVGNDRSCAKRCIEIAPKISTLKTLTERGLYSELGASRAEAILQKMEAFAAGSQAMSPVVARVLRWLEPKNGGLDFGDPQTLQLVEALTTEGLFTQEEYNLIAAMSLVQNQITADNVSAAMAASRAK